VALTIDQFMWEWQPHFRISVQSKVTRALELMEARLVPQVFLVGFADEPTAVRHLICIEPEAGPLHPDHLTGVVDRAGEIFDADPERLLLHSDPGLHESRQRWLRRRARGAAVAEAIEASRTMPGKRLIVSSAGHVAGFEVHTCAAVDREAFDALPRLQGEYINRFPAPSSLLGHLIDLALREADAALERRNPGVGAIRRSAEDLVVDATNSFVAGCAFRAGNFREPWLFGPVTRVSQRAYERAGAAGRLLLVNPEHEHLEILTRLERPVAIGASRAVRKLLETTDEHVALLVDEHGVFGFGRMVDPDAHDVFEIAVAHATWELRTRGVGLLRVAYGVPTLPSPIYDSAGVADVLRRVLGPEAILDRLHPLIGAATAARHGTTLVISAVAANEAARLSGQSTLIEPTELTAELLTHYSQIDGAVLIDPSGVCHAIGVILDGFAQGEGDPSRGARFNSAVRYQHSAPAATVAIVVSEDGDVVCVPTLRPRVRRQDVLDAMTLLEAASTSEEPGQFSNAYDEVRRLAFYLSPAQCTRANELARLERDRALAAGGVSIVWSQFLPDEKMNESYLLE
jgi:hypothetical protein